MDERSYNQPLFNDPKICQNEGCEEGFIYYEILDEYGNPQLEKEKCPYCQDGFIEN